MTHDEMARKTAAINYEIIITHGLDGGPGSSGKGCSSTIHSLIRSNGASAVDPAQQYGGAYTESIFVTDPASALEMAQRQLRAKASDDLNHYCLEQGLDAAAGIETACGVRVPHSGAPLETLTDLEVVKVWLHVEGAREAAE